MVKLQQNVSLKDYSSYKIGGNASYFLDAKTKEDIIEGIKTWDKLSKDFPENSKRIFVLGRGTNILFSDTGFDGLVIKNSIAGFERLGEKITVGAGESFAKLLDFCIVNSLSGLEWAGGLPGTVGGAVRGNAGAFGGETKDNVLETVSLNLKTLEIIKRGNKDCLFSYRNSIFKSELGENEIILSVTLALKPGNKELIKNSILEKIDYRNRKHPMEYPNIGSTFKNVKVESVPENWKRELVQYMKNDPFPLIPSAKLLFLANVKGKKIGDAMISDKHPNFIVNLGNATSHDVKTLIIFAKNAVKEKFNIELEEEIMYLGSA